MEYSDIILSIPEFDSDDETYRMAHVWAYWRGKRVTYTVCDDDGNHEPLCAMDLKQMEKGLHQAWQDYYQHVVKTGEDSVGEFRVKEEKTIKRNVVIYLANWIGNDALGLKVTGIRMGGKVLDPGETPKGFQEWLTVDKTRGVWTMPDYRSEDQLRTELKDHVGCIGRTKGGIYIKATAEWKEPRNPATVRREMIKKAKAALARSLKK